MDSGTVSAQCSIATSFFVKGSLSVFARIFEFFLKKFRLRLKIKILALLRTETIDEKCRERGLGGTREKTMIKTKS